MILRLARDVKIRGMLLPEGMYIDNNFKYYRTIERDLVSDEVAEDMYLSVEQLNSITLLNKINRIERTIKENSISREEKLRVVSELHSVKKNISNNELNSLYENIVKRGGKDA